VSSVVPAFNRGDPLSKRPGVDTQLAASLARALPLPPFRLAHISDLHLPPPERGAGPELQPKRLLSRYAWRRKRLRHDPAALAAIAADVRAADPDHVAVTGDLTNFSRLEELEAAALWLGGLGPPQAVTVSPGNHDALVGRSGAARFAPWTPWLGDEPELEFPKVRRRGPVALVNLCSAQPTALHLAQGVLDPEQLQRLPAILRRLRAEGAFRILLLHHPPAHGVVSRRKSLRQGPELRSILAAEGCELVLHGHGHQATVAALEGPEGAIPVLGAPSASSSGRHGPAARWHLFEIDRGPHGWAVRVEARGLRGGGGGVERLGRYALAPSSSVFHRPS